MKKQVDLTLSDSEDDDDIPLKRLMTKEPESARNLYQEKSGGEFRLFYSNFHVFKFNSSHASSFVLFWESGLACLCIKKKFFKN